ncbi:phosphopantetheine-binding protein [Streptomyces kanamyceticus]|uniref:Acyl carrier protein n=1 Tax=Streptomyces kanamyceticus TaxID=1967 RepID=A0A5J6GNL5_STRKN|nr:phosphopantetheine-binding protein [Streptomyces kanamyceticus]QEU95964.1 acyl carrier protein [Streptomyces kanamyceticus]
MSSAVPNPNTPIAIAVTEVLSRVLSVPEDEVTPDARLVDELDADSLDLSEIAAGLAGRGFLVDKADLKSRAVTVADLIGLVNSPPGPA